MKPRSMARMTLLAAAASAALVLMLAGAAVAAPPPDCSVPGKACNDLYVVAHEDDDLLFMSPAVRRSIENKRVSSRLVGEAAA